MMWTVTRRSGLTQADDYVLLSFTQLLKNGGGKNNKVTEKMCVHLPTSVHHESQFEERSELNYTQQLAAIISYCFFKTSLNASQCLPAYFLILQFPPLIGISSFRSDQTLPSSQGNKKRSRHSSSEVGKFNSQLNFAKPPVSLHY